MRRESTKNQNRPSSDGTETSYVEYYRKAYNKEIKDGKQPARKDKRWKTIGARSKVTTKIEHKAEEFDSYNITDDGR